MKRPLRKLSRCSGWTGGRRLVVCKYANMQIWGSQSKATSHVAFSVSWCHVVVDACCIQGALNKLEPKFFFGLF